MLRDHAPECPAVPDVTPQAVPAPCAQCGCGQVDVQALLAELRAIRELLSCQAMSGVDL